MEMCRFSILGKLTMAKGEEPWTWAKLKEKLDVLWNLNSQWRLISIGKGYFHIILSNQEEYDRVWSKEVLFLKPGMLRLQSWKFGFDPTVEKTTKAQVWFRILQLPWCLWDSSVILGIASNIGQPLRIDRQTLEGSFGHYARVLIEVDLAKSITSSILVDCNDQILEVQISPENMPNFCRGCYSIGHSAKDCKRFLRTEKDASSSKSECPHMPTGSKREHRDFGLDERIGTSSSKRTTQHSEWRRKKVQVIGNENVQLTDKPFHAIVETVTDFSAQLGSQSPIDKRADVLVISNQFAALETEVEVEEMVVDSTPLIQEIEEKDGEGDGINAQLNEEDIDIPKIPSRWSDLIDEEGAAENPYPHQEVNSSSMETSSNFERTYGNISGFRAKIHEDCIWLNHDDDSKYDRDMCVEIERYKNSAKATRNFIANLPKKEKKVKMAFRQPQRKAGSPKE